MTPATPSPEDAELDALAELLADKLVELARRPGLFRLAAGQMAGLLPECGMDDDSLAHVLGCTPRTVSNYRRKALEKLAMKPEVLALARSITQP